jgi:hypothetical protein
MENEPLEQLPASKPGDRVLRRLRKPRKKLNAVYHGISRYFRSISGKH